MQLTLRLAILLGMGSLACLAQMWEVGGAGGGSGALGLNATGAAGTATAGFQPGVAASFVVGQNLYTRLTGELRYTYLQDDLKLSSGGTEATFGAAAHAIHYDLLWHFGKGEGRVQPFVAAGGGMKLFEGTGAQQAYQPLSQFAYFTHAQQLEPMISAGGGIRMALKTNVVLRIEFRDYLTPFPGHVIAAAPGMHISGWVHDFVPLVGISYLFGK
jgi:outer membrane protein W